MKYTKIIFTIFIIFLLFNDVFAGLYKTTKKIEFNSAASPIETPTYKYDTDTYKPPPVEPKYNAGAGSGSSGQNVNTNVSPHGQGSGATGGMEVLNQQIKAKQLDLQSGGHGRQRHGSHITPQQHKTRLETGKAPDGEFAATNISTNFRKSEFDKTLKYAKKTYAKKNGINWNKPPKGKKKKDLYREQIVNHNRSIGDGYKGKPNSKIEITNPNSGSKRVGYTDYNKVNNLSKTITRWQWNQQKKQWDVITHYPTE